jgi:hypothetical protein
MRDRYHAEGDSVQIYFSERLSIYAMRFGAEPVARPEFASENL